MTSTSDTSTTQSDLSNPNRTRLSYLLESSQRMVVEPMPLGAVSWLDRTAHAVYVSDSTVEVAQAHQAARSDLRYRLDTTFPVKAATPIALGDLLAGASAGAATMALLHLLPHLSGTFQAVVAAAVSATAYVAMHAHASRSHRDTRRLTPQGRATHLLLDLCETINLLTPAVAETVARSARQLLWVIAGGGEDAARAEADLLVLSKEARLAASQQRHRRSQRNMSSFESREPSWSAAVDATLAHINERDTTAPTASPASLAATQITAPAVGV